MGWLYSAMDTELVPAILHIHIENIADAPEANRAARPQSRIYRHSLLCNWLHTLTLLAQNLKCTSRGLCIFLLVSPSPCTLSASFKICRNELSVFPSSTG